MGVLFTIQMSTFSLYFLFFRPRYNVYCYPDGIRLSSRCCKDSSVEYCDLPVFFRNHYVSLFLSIRSMLTLKYFSGVLSCSNSKESWFSNNTNLESLFPFLTSFNVTLSFCFRSLFNTLRTSGSSIPE